MLFGRGAEAVAPGESGVGGDFHHTVQLGYGSRVQLQRASPAAVPVLGPDVAKQAQLRAMGKGLPLLLRLAQEPGRAWGSDRCRLSGAGSVLLPVHLCILRLCFRRARLGRAGAA